MAQMVIESKKREIMADLRKYFKNRFSPKAELQEITETAD
jgi:hypothetical protein